MWGFRKGEISPFLFGHCMKLQMTNIMVLEFACCFSWGWVRVPHWVIHLKGTSWRWLMPPNREITATQKFKDAILGIDCNHRSSSWCFGAPDPVHLMFTCPLSPLWWRKDFQIYLIPHVGNLFCLLKTTPSCSVPMLLLPLNFQLSIKHHFQ